MKPNNFQELERQEMEQRTVPHKIKAGIDSQVGFFQFIGSIFELYLPKMVDLFVHRMSNEITPKSNDSGLNGKSKYPNQ